jgi:two-component system LytT family sensor kinase
MNATKFFKKEIFWHGVFWLLYLIIRVAIVQLYPGPMLYRIGMELIELPLKMATLYFAIYILIRKLLLQKRYVQFVSMFALYIILTMVLNRLEDYYITYPLIENSISEYRPVFQNLNATFLQNSITRHEDGLWDLGAAFLNLIYIYPVVGLGAAAYFAKGWYDNHLKHESAQKEKLQAELKLLKDQLHPHFLFNTLNNIYSLSQIQSVKTPEMILRLSHLLGFMLYEGSAPFIPLGKELQALKDYIELERLRLGDRLQLAFEATDDLKDSQIAPLILFPFLENCFKHGSHKTTEKVWISFMLTMNGNRMIAQIENSIPPETIPVGDRGEVQSGMGLRNVKQRLDLLYHNKYDLKIYKQESYLVKLELLLS